MGGLIGMMLAAQAGAPIRRLVVNDVGPFIPKASLERIAAYVGTDPHFPDLGAAEAYYRKAHAPFGGLSDAQWRHLTVTSVRADPAGGFRLGYDPGIAAAFKPGEMEDIDLWPLWDRIACPVLVLRGAESDLLLAETAEEMTARGPKAALLTVPGCGHAPALLDPVQTGPILEWLARP
jgi:pimeloyl-ACP methyl ester carboxylesterase